MKTQGWSMTFPFYIGDEVYVDARTVSDKIESYAMEKYLDYEEGEKPKVLSARVVSYQIATKKTVKLAIKARYTVIYTLSGNDYTIDGEYGYKRYPLTAVGLSIFRTREEAEKALEDTSCRPRYKKC